MREGGRGWYIAVCLGFVINGLEEWLTAVNILQSYEPIELYLAVQEILVDPQEVLVHPQEFLVDPQEVLVDPQEFLAGLQLA